MANYPFKDDELKTLEAWATKEISAARKSDASDEELEHAMGIRKKVRRMLDAGSEEEADKKPVATAAKPRGNATKPQAANHATNT